MMDDQGQPDQLSPLSGFAVSSVSTAPAPFFLCISEMPGCAILSHSSLSWQP